MPRLLHLAGGPAREFAVDGGLLSYGTRWSDMYRILGTYAGRYGDLRGWLARAEINRDRNLRLQYLAGQGLNLYRADLIFNDMLKHAQPPPDRLFAGSRDTLAALKGKILVFLGRAPDPGV